MKKLFLAFTAIFLFNFQSYAQLEPLQDNRNFGEVKLNILNTILLGSIEVGYEQFLSPEQSIGVEFHFNDRFSYSGENSNRSFDMSSILGSYNFYFEGEGDGQLYLFPFFKYRFGEFTESVDGALARTNMNSGYLGIGAGYKWVFSDKFVMGPFANIARGFSSEVNDRFSAVEFKAGFNIGYRF